MASKFDQFLKASWNAIFSAQEAPRRASAADRRSGWSRPEPTGGGFRRGKTRTSEKKNPEGGSGRRIRKDSETWIQRSSTPSRAGRRIASRIPPGLILRSLGHGTEISHIAANKFFALRVTPPAHPEPDASRMDLKSRFSKRSRN